VRSSKLSVKPPILHRATVRDQERRCPDMLVTTAVPCPESSAGPMVPDGCLA
jgi:hypothetical protein